MENWCENPTTCPIAQRVCNNLCQLHASSCLRCHLLILTRSQGDKFSRIWSEISRIKCHIHPPYSYKETSSPVEEMIKIQQDCEPDKFYCDACEEETHYYPSIIACAECDFYCYMPGSASESVRLKVCLSFFIIERCYKLLKIISWKLKLPVDI
jgi:hypothetical protein